MGFTKLHEGIIKSSIMAEPSDVFKIFITMLACCGADGVADLCAPAVASICHLPMETVEKALKKLCGPDRHSRSKVEQGRRLKRVDGGYFVINYWKWRNHTYSENVEAVRKREYRAKKSGDVLGHSGTCPGHSASASASSSLRGRTITKGKSMRGENPGSRDVCQHDGDDPEAANLNRLVAEARVEDARLEAELKRKEKKENQ